jgi:hypothetical protein
VGDDSSVDGSDVKTGYSFEGLYNHISPELLFQRKFQTTKASIYLEKLRVAKSAGAKDSLEVGGNSWRVGLSTE